MSKKRVLRADRLRALPPPEPRRSYSPARFSALANSGGDALLRALLDGLHVGVANVDSAGAILYANARFAEIFGAHPADLVNSPLARFISRTSLPELQLALRRGMKAPAEGELKLSGPSGHLRTIQLSLGPLNLDGDPTVMISATEVTELVEKNKVLRATEESLRTLSARILQLQDQERRRIARDLHDITGQELAVIIMSLSQLAKNLENPAVNPQTILSDAVSLVRKVEDEIRTLSYLLHPPLLDEFGLRSALNWYAEGFTKRSGIAVTVDAPRNLCRLSSEKEMALFRVVQESLTNVLRHAHALKARIRVRVQAGSARLSVEDEGRGISPEALAKISEGTTGGVGVQGMRERIQQLGGTLKFRAGQKGTTVTATLPVDGDATRDLESAARAVAPSAESAAAVSAPSHKKRVLIADDHDVTRQGIRTLLKSEPDIEVCGEAQDGAQAVEKARSLDPDLIIMDLTMPVLGGFAAANRIRRSGSRAKILFFTTHTVPQIQRLGNQAGFEGLVTKTNASRDLVPAVRAILQGDRFFFSKIISGGAEPQNDLPLF